MTQNQLEKIIARHQHWLKGDCKGWENMKADLAGADVRHLSLRDADMRGANLHKANLCWVDLSGANLSGADLSGAKLDHASMQEANLYEAILLNTILYDANLGKAKLIGANLRGADLHRAKLCMANLTGADLTGAKLSDAYLTGANLTGADLTGAKLSEQMDNADIRTATFSKQDEFRKGIILAKPIKGYKKTKENVVITAEIPAGAVVFSINGKKCRTNMATITDMAGHKLLHSRHDSKFKYTLGKKIIITDFDTRYNVECSTGFHFFRKKKEAEDY